MFHDNVHKPAGLPDIPTAGKSYGHTTSVGLCDLSSFVKWPPQACTSLSANYGSNTRLSMCRALMRGVSRLSFPLRFSNHNLTWITRFPHVLHIPSPSFILPSSRQSTWKSLGPLIINTQVTMHVIRLNNPADTSLIKMLHNLFHETLNLNVPKSP